MNRKITVFALGPLLFALSSFAEVQQAKKIPRIGFVMGSRQEFSVAEKSSCDQIL